MTQDTETRSTDTRSVGRRSLLGLGAAAVGTLAAPAIVRADTKLNWKMVTSWPKNSPGVGVNAQRLADAITTMSGGRLTVQLFAAGELVPPFECFDAVSSGAAEMAHASPYFWQGKDKAFHFFTGVPFGLFANEHMGWIWYGGGQQLWEKAYAPFGVQPFYCGSSGPQAGLGLGQLDRGGPALEGGRGVHPGQRDGDADDEQQGQRQGAPSQHPPAASAGVEEDRGGGRGGDGLDGCVGSAQLVLVSTLWCHVLKSPCCGAPSPPQRRGRPAPPRPARPAWTESKMAQRAQFDGVESSRVVYELVAVSLMT